MKFITQCLLLSLLSTTLVLAQTPQQFTAQNPCTSKETLQECIQTPLCSWCYDPAFIGNASCFQPSSPFISKDEMCDKKYTCNSDNVMQHYQENSPECHYQGTYKCGICECNLRAYGRHCECDGIARNETLGCINPHSTTNMECSGRGRCVCGVCECEVRGNNYERIYGDYCECDNFSCEHHQGLLCSGEDHGTCECGKCHCRPNFKGTNCACEDSVTGCYAPGDERSEIMCSGHGKCECNKCQCDSSEESRYSGKFCDMCLTCPGPDRCPDFKDCVQCQVYHTGPLKEPSDCSENCAPVGVPIIVDKVEANEENDEYLCHYTDEDQCQFSYVYYYDAAMSTFKIRAQSERICPPEEEDSIRPIASTSSTASRIENKNENAGNQKPAKNQTIACEEILEKVNRQLDDDNYDIIGRYIANKLREMSKDTAIVTEKLIIDVIFEAQMGNVSRYTKLNFFNENIHTHQMYH